MKKGSGRVWKEYGKEGHGDFSLSMGTFCILSEHYGNGGEERTHALSSF